MKNGSLLNQHNASLLLLKKVDASYNRIRHVRRHRCRLMSRCGRISKGSLEEEVGVSYVSLSARAQILNMGSSSLRFQCCDEVNG